MTRLERDAIIVQDYDGWSRPEILRQLINSDDDWTVTHVAYLMAYTLIASLVGIVAAITLILWWITN